MLFIGIGFFTRRWVKSSIPFRLLLDGKWFRLLTIAFNYRRGVYVLEVFTTFVSIFSLAELDIVQLFLQLLNMILHLYNFLDQIAIF